MAFADCLYWCIILTPISIFTLSLVHPFKKMKNIFIVWKQRLDLEGQRKTLDTIRIILYGWFRLRGHPMNRLVPIVAIVAVGLVGCGQKPAVQSKPKTKAEILLDNYRLAKSIRQDERNKFEPNLRTYWDLSYYDGYTKGLGEVGFDPNQLPVKTAEPNIPEAEIVKFLEWLETKDLYLYPQERTVRKNLVQSARSIGSKDGTNGGKNVN